MNQPARCDCCGYETRVPIGTDSFPCPRCTGWALRRMSVAACACRMNRWIKAGGACSVCGLPVDELQPTEAERLLLAMVQVEPCDPKSGWCSFCEGRAIHRDDCKWTAARRYLVARGLLQETP